MSAHHSADGLTSELVPDLEAGARSEATYTSAHQPNRQRSHLPTEEQYAQQSDRL